MKLPFPTHAERITIGGETAWMWSTQEGWNIRQGAYQVDLTNFTREGKPFFMIDTANLSPDEGISWESYFSGQKAGHLSKEQFIVDAERRIAALRKKFQPPQPPANGGK